ncbi:MAG: hypothetical protein ACXVZX_16485 [Terriglobales bacterium]
MLSRLLSMDDPIERPLHPDTFSRVPVRVDGRILIKTTCNNCQKQFVGNTDDAVVWEERHYFTC